MSVQSSIPNLDNFRYTFSTYSIEPFDSILRVYTIIVQ